MKPALLLPVLCLLAGCLGAAAPPASAPPQVTGLWPEDGAVAVPRAVRIRFTFDQAMDTATLARAVRLRQRDGTGAVLTVTPAALRYDAVLRSLFVEATFAGGQEAEAELTAGACASSGEPLRAPAATRFLVEADPRAWWEYAEQPAALGHGRDGALAFRGAAVPPCPGTLTTPAGVFTWLCRRADDDDSGWLRTDAPPRTLGTAGDPLTPAEIAAGSYSATLAGRRPATPLAWVHLSHNRGGLWLDPARFVTGAVRIPGVS